MAKEFDFTLSSASAGGADSFSDLADEKNTSFPVEVLTANDVTATNGDRMASLSEDAAIPSSLHVINMPKVLYALRTWNKQAGGYIQLSPDFAHLPILIGNDNEPVALYELVETLDGLVDFDDIQEEFPNLSYAQIDGAIAFLRKVAQYNSKGIDVDDLEDEAMAQDQEFLRELREALADQETFRVFDLKK